MTAALALVVGVLINLTGPGHYIHWGFIQISVGNLVFIGLMVVTFLAASWRRCARGACGRSASSVPASA